MPIEDGLYLIHSSGERIRNYYPVVEYDGQQITTISGASTQPPTEVSHVVFFFCFGSLSDFITLQWQVQRHPESDTYTITAKGTRITWSRVTNRYGDDIVIHTSKPSEGSNQWKFIEVNTRTNDPLVG